jgi:outer membrane protein assembly factor BamB
MRVNWSKRFLKAALLVSGFAIAGCAANQLPVEDSKWNTHLGDYARTNISAGKAALPLVIGWDRDVSDFKIFRPFPKEQLSSPAIHKGRLYAGSANGHFYATDLASGKVYWEFNAKAPIEAAPTVTDDKVCFGASDGKMRCLDLEGRLLWEFQARSEILSAPIVSGDKVLFSSSDDRIHALNAAKGERLWTYSRGTYKTVTPRVYASPALSGKGNLFYLFSDGVVVSVSAETGKELWSKKAVKEFDEAAPPRRTPLVDSGTVYVIDDNQAVMALSEETGEVKGIYNIIKATDFVVPDSRAIVIAGEGQAIALDRSTGALLWKTGLSHGPVSSVFSAGDYLFVLSNFKKAPFGIDYLAKDKGYMEALKLSDGTIAWGRPLDSSITADASTSLERVALITNDGELTVFEPKD